MKIHCLHNEFFEGVASIERWAGKKGYCVSHTLFYNNETDLPSHADYDCLIILGGYMFTREEHKFGWLRPEKEFIREAIQFGKVIFGICLGAQLIAEVLGGRVYKGAEKEIGYFPVRLSPEAKNSLFFRDFPEEFLPLSWHSDTFDLPPGATRLAYNQAYENQAFQYGNRVLGVQFHLEFSQQDVQRMLKWSRNGKPRGPFEQSKEEILSRPETFPVNYSLLELLLEALDAEAKSSTSRLPLLRSVRAA